MSEYTLRELCNQARSLLASESHAQAIEIGRHILRYYPLHIESYVILGEACLERGEIREAMELFQRALSADPEQTRAWVGLASAHELDELLDPTIWYMERAFELEPTNAGIRQALQELYGKRHNIKDLRIKLNAAALGRIYLRGGLYHQAINELQEVLRQAPDRHYIKVALAGAYWYVGRRVDAAGLCQELLEQLPNCLQAHLILGEIWSRGDRPEEGQQHLRMAEALDPENRVAQALFGYDSPLPPRQPTLPSVGQAPPAARPPAMPALDAPGRPAIAELASSPIPDESALAEEVVSHWLKPQPAAVAAEEAAPASAENEAAPAVEVPAWLRATTLAEEAPTPSAEEPAAPSAPPAEDWRAAVSELPPELRALVEETVAEEAAPPPEVEIPAWLRAEEPAAPSAPPAEDWRAAVSELPPELRALVEETVAEEAAPAVEAPAWLRAEEPAAPSAPPAVPVSVEPPTASAPIEIIEKEVAAEEPGAGPPPAWLEDAQLPAWLAEAAAPAPSATEPVPPVAPFVKEEETPEWLRRLAEEPAGESALPAWLVAPVQPTEPEPAAAAPALASQAEEAAPLLSSAMLEEMLAGIAPPAEEVEAAPPTAEAVPVEEPPTAPVAAAEPAEAEAVVAAAEPAEETGITSPFIAQAIERLRVRPDDHETRLALARAWRDHGRLDSALPHYEQLVDLDHYVDLVVTDMERLVMNQMGNPRIWIVLGDAYMRQGRLSDAMSAYRSALGR